MGCAPFWASVLVIVARPQGNCLSLHFDYLWECLWILGGWKLLQLHWGSLLHPAGLFSNAMNIYSLSQLKPDKMFKRTFF